MRREVSFDRPPDGFTRHGQENGSLVVPFDQHGSSISKLQSKIDEQSNQIAELRAMIDGLTKTKRGKKDSVSD